MSFRGGRFAPAPTDTSRWGAGSPPVLPDLVDTACQNARALVRICDLIDQVRPELKGLQEAEIEDGAFILPE